MSGGFTALARRVRADIGQRHRYAHSVRVARLAASLARAHGEDVERARLAGILHDLARLFSAEELLRECESRGIAIDAFERRHPVVLHARVGAELARERHGIHDEAVLDAIRLHTLAGAKMSRLAVLLYLADGLEPGRRFPERGAYLRTAHADLDEAMRLLLKVTADHQRTKGHEVAPQTLAAIETFAARGVAGAPGEEERMEDRLCRT